ncbi:MAG: bifunctional DNA-formamidopyrimidine glycosylase/DNA-(apurinic or apyrimidinic site) lyase [Chloroflexi bacterium]|nr:MAG: bifunctional DNA-formamidopyrimidine glycosylase/DNA-(apurinic or apyrimidinic site) lyase [Chloroflexota bacterium]MBL1195286.1 bifunctional DNA-formamidopyrimidine glycosylase/DNA-(apurinic or apyrimidinic site) lyase [Chloroflexota bacterium]NOH12570.1 bifunctional DNA-formamidopyrimidine glycosylase/DNA-(apurinic or apyrimidinic site) lyase [Chloroflexota bacterium]
MPELPEVETIARAMREGGRGAPPVVGHRIKDVELLWKRTLDTPGPRSFKRRIIGQRIEDVGRRAKYLQFKLSEDTMLVHLRMTGDLLVGSGRKPLGKHPRMVFYLDKNKQLSFNDARKFGRIWLLEDDSMVLGKLGPEPLDSSLTAAKFYKNLKERKRQLKPLLLDQNFIAGLGNIYIDEALNLAKIHPTTQANLLNEKQAQALLKAIRKVLKEAIRRNGASIDWAYRGGDFQNDFRVYQQTGEPCQHCGTPIDRIVVGQRGTHLCTHCQVPLTA